MRQGRVAVGRGSLAGERRKEKGKGGEGRGRGNVRGERKEGDWGVFDGGESEEGLGREVS
jgi:hypothetical protein